MKYRAVLGFAFFLFAFNVMGQKLITGRVTDLSSKPLSYAIIHLLNTPITTVSDPQGYFSIQHVLPGKYTIELSAIGYATVTSEIEVNKMENQPLLFQLQNSLIRLEAITVTAEKKEELLQKIPLSITALSSRQVQDFRLWDVKELTAIVPNLYSGNSGDERNVTSIRGITTTSYDPAVATYVDGVNQFTLDTYIAQLSDIERIEVLRGPQGTLYGRNAMGGVINILTKQPANNTSGFVELNFGDYGQQRYNASIRIPVINNHLFFSASGLFSKGNGYYSNQFNNSHFDSQNAFSGNYYIKYLSQKKWAITLNVKHQNNRNNGAFPLVNGVDEALSHPFQLSQNAIGKMIDNTLNASLSFNYSGSYFNFISQTAWQSNLRYYNAPIDGDFSPLDIVTINNNYGKPFNKVKVLTQEFRFNSTPNRSSRLDWTVGTYFFHQYGKGKQATHFGADAGLIGIPDSNFSVINTTIPRNNGIAVFGQVNYKISKKITLIAGMRYDYENKMLNIKGEYQKDGQNVFVTQPDTSAIADFSAISPKLGLQIQLSANSYLFSSFSRGFRTGGLTQLSGDPSQPPLYPYKPEYSNNIEAGIKNHFLNERMFLDITAFLTYINNAQVPTLILPDAITLIKNTGELVSKGAELELTSKPFNGFELVYNFGYTDAKYRSLKVANNGQLLDLDGKKQIFTPDVTSLFAPQYSYIINKKQQIKLVARIEWFYLGTRYFDLANNIKQPPYHLINARVGVSNKYVDIFFWFRNLTDKTYIEYAYDFGAVHLGNPRTYGVTIKTNF